jgi:hypothetical protein
VGGLNHSKCSTKPLIYVRNIQKAKAEKKSWYQYIFSAAENRGSCMQRRLFSEKSTEGGQTSRIPVVQPPIAELVDTAIPYDQLGLLGNSKITSHIYSEAPETEKVNKWRL